MSEKNKHIGLRCTEEMLTKLKYISEFEGRSINAEILYLINREIKRFENKYSVISNTDN